MMRHIDDSQLNDYLDEILSDEDSRSVQSHLDGCAECATNLSELRGLVAEMGDLPLEAEPTRDLWVGIQKRIDGTYADVLELPSGRRVSTSRRVSMSWGQLLAASIALASVSGGVVWTALQTSPSMGSFGAPGSSFVSPVAAVQVATHQYARAILELEQLIEAGRDVLASETMLSLEKSLAAVDQAIGEAQAALSSDPHSGLLNRLLANHQQAKLRVLQRTLASMRI